MLEPVVAELDVHTMRDPTRGGCAAALHEIADASGESIELEEDALPVPEVVEGACSLLGTDPLEMPNEGKALVILPAGEADRAVDILRSHKYGREACRIGRVVERGSFPLTLATALGERLVDAPRGELLPRIC
jgi:hydrogenase expression/formation protein HypE